MQLYGLCDQALLDKHNLSLLKYLEIIKSHGIKILQYRNKSADIQVVKDQLITLREHYDGHLIINDFLELTPYCDGVHLGQEDVLEIDQNKKHAITALREIVGKDKIIGISTHNKQEVLEANGFDVNYIGLGAYRQTSTKDVQTVLGDTIEEIAALSVHEVAAIGGVRLDDRFKNIAYNVIGSALL
jgi:thiamine-phosphate pyrophosphorylase